MANQSSETSGNGTGARLLCVMAGVFLGGLIGLAVLTPKDSLRNNPDPQAQMFAKIFRPFELCLSVAGLLVGAGIGATLGAVAGAVLIKPAARDAIASEPAPDESPPVPASPASDEELRRLEQEIERLQARVDEIQQEAESGGAQNGGSDGMV